MIEQEFVPYAEALALKELGFDELCFAYYKDMKGKKVLLYDSMDFDGECNTPLYQQAFRWFREKYGLYSCIMYNSDGIIKGGYSPMIDVMKPHKATLDLNTYDIYEEAELASLRRLIEIANEKHTNSTGIS